MNFIRLYIGDYLRDTGTLTVLEHGAYMLMLLHHYATESPLPQGRELHRLLRAETKADRDAIDAMAAKFWKASPEGLVNDRAAKEIARADHQRTVNQETGKRGGRPKRTETESVSESVSESQPNANPNQTPDTRHQTEIHPPTPRKRGREVHAFPPGFDAFWAAYPRKTAKDSAAKAYARIKPDDRLQARILAALSVQAASEQWTRDGGRFVPHAATWLNGRRWEDEATAAGNDPFAGAA